MSRQCPMCSRKIATSKQLAKAIADRAEIIEYADRLIEAMTQAIELLCECDMDYEAMDLAETLVSALPKKGTLAGRAQPWVQRIDEAMTRPEDADVGDPF